MTVEDDQSKKSGQKSNSEGIAPALEAEDATRVWRGEDPELGDDVATTQVYEASVEASEEVLPRRSGQLAPGTVLFGEYEIEGVLGSGGMGEVYKARHRALGEYRAIKVLHAEISAKEVTATLFLREAKALLSVRHPAVVHCHDLLSDDEGRVFLVMELIEGCPLAERMSEGPLSTDDVAILGGRLAAGLHAAHEQGVVHRDISPDNIVLEAGDVARAKLIDFGIAKLLESGQGTVVDGFKGKLSYASPEQLGFFGGRIDGRSDLYSLGLVLCAASLGHPIGMGKTVVEAVDARRSLQALPDQIPVGLRSALEPLLSLDPADRPERAERLFLAADASVRLPPLSQRPRPPRKEIGPVALVLAGGALLLILVLGLIGYRLAGERASSPSSAEPSSLAVAISPEAAEPALPLPRSVVSLPQEASVVPARAPSALDELKIMGLLRGADDALEEDRLRRPPGRNAFEKYQAVLKLDPKNAVAEQGLMNVAGRYLTLSERALSAGDLGNAVHYLSEAVQVAPNHPSISRIEAALANVGE